MDDKSKKHHYVPQSMLRRFSSDSDQSKIWVFDKKTLKSFSSSILDAGCENHFHTADVGGKAINFEPAFEDNDNRLAYLLDKIVRDRCLATLTPEERLVLSEVVAVQLGRTKIRRTTPREIAKQVAASAREAGFSTGLNGPPIPTDEQLKLASLISLGDLSAIINNLDNKRLVLIASPNEIPFWISDNPVTTWNLFPYGEIGVAEKGIEIYMPISPELVLGFWCQSIEIKIGQWLERKIFGDDHQRISAMFEGINLGNPISFGPETTNYLNELQVASSSRFLYGPTNDFTLAEKMVADDPELRDVQSFMTVAEGLPPRLGMPEGHCVVFYGRLNHHMLKATRLDNEAVGLAFETPDLLTLQELIDDQPIELTRLYQDGYEIMGTRATRLEISKIGKSAYVRLIHQEELLNEIEKIIAAKQRDGN
jgi:Protein of unknown function (DUF4238)